MSLLSEVEKKEISKKFELPERKSKIATMLKQNDQLYCICRSTDSTSFMIACDGCEEWYHGDCIGITQQESKAIKVYFCQACKEINPTLKIVYKKKPGSHPKEKHETGSSSKTTSSSSAHTSKKTVVDKSPQGKRKVSKDYSSTVLSPRNSTKFGAESESEEKEVSEDSEGFGEHERRSSKRVVKKKKRNMPRRSGGSSRRTHHESDRDYEPSEREHAQEREVLPAPKSSSSTDSSDAEEVDDSVQCKGPQCVNAAREGSSYCSDNCGLRLASHRIHYILPQRLSEYMLTPSVADLHNRKELAETQKKLVEVKEEIHSLEVQRQELDDHVARVEHVEVDEDHEDDEPEEEGTVHCVTCGHEVAVRACMKHMEKCYKKIESQTSFGSIYQTNVEIKGELFCDVFNPANSSYCKRLAVLCPEHSKEVKVGDLQVCGFRLVDDKLKETGEICMLPKKRCNTHFSWEKISRACIDMERVRQYLKQDDLLEQERQIKLAMAGRGGLMGLLMNSTFDHVIQEKLQRQREEEERWENERQNQAAAGTSRGGRSERNYRNESSERRRQHSSSRSSHSSRSPSGTPHKDRNRSGSNSRDNSLSDNGERRSRNRSRGHSGQQSPSQQSRSNSRSRSGSEPETLSSSASTEGLAMEIDDTPMSSNVPSKRQKNRNYGENQPQTDSIPPGGQLTASKLFKSRNTGH